MAMVFNLSMSRSLPEGPGILEQDAITQPDRPYACSFMTCTNLNSLENPLDKNPKPYHQIVIHFQHIA